MVIGVHVRNAPRYVYMVVITSIRSGNGASGDKDYDASTAD